MKFYDKKYDIKEKSWDIRYRKNRYFEDEGIRNQIFLCSIQSVNRKINKCDFYCNRGSQMEFDKPGRPNCLHKILL